MQTQFEESVAAVHSQQRTAKYSQETLQKALQEVKSGAKTVYAASILHNIPTSTLHAHHLNIHGSKPGKDTTLSADYERLLVDWIIKCAESMNPQTKQQIISAAEGLSLLDSTSNFKRGAPTDGWFKRFMQRHHDEISRRTPQNLGKASSNITKQDLMFAFDYIYNQFSEQGCLDLMDKPAQWWNADETNFLMNPLPGKVYARKGSKNVHNKERGKPKENVTVTYAVSAAGQAIPPLLTFKESFSGIEGAAVIARTIGADFAFNQTSSGWMKGDAFFDFITEHLDKHWIEMSLPRPIVLAVDGYSAHHSLKLFKWCLENEVKLLILPPNTTHLTQVLDVAVFKPLKTRYAQQYQQWKSANKTQPFNEFEFIKVLKLASDEVLARKETIINGWRATGLQPFNFDNLDTSQLLDREPREPDTEVENLEVDTPFASKVTVLNHRRLQLPQDQFGNLLSEDFDRYEIYNEPRYDGFDTALENPADQQVQLDAEELLEDSMADIPYQHDDFHEAEENDGEVSKAMVENPPHVQRSIDQTTKKLADAARRAVSALKVHLRVHDPGKNLNILIMEQQLNIIEPISCQPELPKPSTPEDILKVPVKNIPKARRGNKINFGIMSSSTIVEQMEQREIAEKEAKTAKEKAAIEKCEAQKARLIAENEVLEARKALKLKTAAMKNVIAETTAKRKAGKAASQGSRPPKKRSKVETKIHSTRGKSNQLRTEEELVEAGEHETSGNESSVDL